MITGRRNTDGLRDAAENLGESDRRGADRRSADRRAPRRRFDPLFAATLVNQIAATEEIPPGLVKGYAAPQPRPRRGASVTLRV